MQEEVAHDAVQLLDRAMMAPEKPTRDCMSATAPAALHLAACQDGQHSRDALALQTGIASLTGAAACPLASCCHCDPDVCAALPCLLMATDTPMHVLGDIPTTAEDSAMI